MLSNPLLPAALKDTKLRKDLNAGPVLEDTKLPLDLNAGPANTSAAAVPVDGSLCHQERVNPRPLLGRRMAEKGVLYTSVSSKAAQSTVGLPTPLSTAPPRAEKPTVDLSTALFSTQDDEKRGLEESPSMKPHLPNPNSGGKTVGATLTDKGSGPAGSQAQVSTAHPHYPPQQVAAGSNRWNRSQEEPKAFREITPLHESKALQEGTRMQSAVPALLSA